MLTACRQGLINIPLLFLMDRLFGLFGIVWTQLIADSLTLVISMALYAGVLRRLYRDEPAAAGAAPTTQPDGIPVTRRGKPPVPTRCRPGDRLSWPQSDDAAAASEVHRTVRVVAPRSQGWRRGVVGDSTIPRDRHGSDRAWQEFQRIDLWLWRRVRREVGTDRCTFRNIAPSATIRAQFRF